MTRARAAQAILKCRLKPMATECVIRAVSFNIRRWRARLCAGRGWATRATSDTAGAYPQPQVNLTSESADRFRDKRTPMARFTRCSAIVCALVAAVPSPPRAQTVTTVTLGGITFRRQDWSASDA